MLLSLYPYQLQFKFPFRIAHGLRTHTDVVYVKLEHEGFTAWGEATLPPYLPETQKSVIDFLSRIPVDIFKLPLNPEEIFEEINVRYSGNMSAKAALDMALWSLKSQMERKTIGELLGIPTTGYPEGTYTIGVCNYDEMKLKVEAANNCGFKIFKLKLNGENDEQVINDFLKLSSKPFAVDVNQGWKSIDEAAEKIAWLKEKGCLFVEQPLHKDALNEMKLLKEKSDLPLYADESCQVLSDIDNLKEAFDGVNIKLMKCGGITPAFQMIKRAKELGLKVLVGCMSESSVGCTAAAHLTPLADYADLDGPYLIANDPFEGMKVEDGRIAMYPLQQKIQL